MSTGISNLDLINKCGEFIKSDAQTEFLDANIKNALITANREICTIDKQNPLAWMRETYDELNTKYHAEISAITQASPGVITADSLNPDLGTDHGFATGDLIHILGISGMERLNFRTFRATRASATTISLTQLDGKNAINTTATTDPETYEEYDSGGYIYHAGITIPYASIEPTAAQETTESYRWKIKRVWDVSRQGQKVA
jgi:hypothetical protein